MQENRQDLDALDGRTTRFRSDLLQRYRLDRKLPALQVLLGPDTGLRIRLVGESVTLGRALEADVVLADENISRRHALIEWDPRSGDYVLTDLGSTNGTILNDQQVRTARLKDGDKIFLGTTIVKFVMLDEVESESGELVDRYLFRDDLTGLPVKRRFYSELRLRLQVAAAYGHPLSVLMMDMDGLKQVNDRHGHSTGAFVIGESGRRIGRICEGHGQACRYGGDEFIAYLTGAGKREAVALGETIAAAIRGEPFVKDGLSLSLSISVGVAAFPEDGSTAEALAKAADKALYRAKAAGRNRVSD